MTHPVPPASEPGSSLDAAELTSCLGSLVSLLALPSLCQGCAPAQILTLTLESLETVVPFEVACLRIGSRKVDHAFRVRDLEKIGDDPDARETLRDLLHSLMTIPTVPVGTEIDTVVLGKLRVAVVPIGFYAGTGMLLAGAARPDFPTTSELIHLRAVASLVGSTIQEARARERLEQTRAELERANRAKDEFLAMLGHELRNPLAPIVTALELLRVRGDDVTREHAIIERQVTHLRQLVDDLLDISRITGGKVELRRRVVEMSGIITRAVEMASPLLESQKHQLSTDCAAEGLPVDVDPGRCAQVIANLLTNAAKYTEPGGQISISASREGDDVIVRVRDNGIGIGPKMLTQVFNLFSQERRAINRAKGGLGLGLAIVKSLIGLHGGTVEAHSDGLGHGSEFTVRLPAALNEQRVSVPEASTASGEWRRSQNRKHLVLIVDDNEDAAEMLGELVSHRGYSIAIAADGAEALRMAAEKVPALVLLDIGLPVMDGYEVAERLAADPRFDGTRLVALTGYGQESDRRRTRKAGFHAHLVKPVDTLELTATIEKLLAEAPHQS